MPSISVLMGVYHPGDDTNDLRRAVDSVLGQTFEDFEFLICDDGSSKTVQNLLEQYAEQDNRVRLIRPGNVFRLPDKLNACIHSARGDFFARQDADDLSALNRFEKQIAFLKTHLEIAFVGCNVTLICDGKECGERCFPKLPQKEDFLFSMPFIHPALMFRRNAILAVGGYSQSKWAVLCEDYDLLLRLYEKGFYGYNLNEHLFFYQVSPFDYKKRKYHHRINEAVTRYRRFRALGMLPKGLPYVIKPLAVGLLPHKVLDYLKRGQTFQRRRHHWK